ncbi:MAG: FAD-binding oxidoreductase [Ferruginibacter sp.]
MVKNMQRKDFLKIALLAPLGIYEKRISKYYQVEQTTNVDYFRKSEQQYENLRKGFNKRIDKFPQVIALCKNTAGVAEAVLYANANRLPVAIKSGGHCMEGFSANDNGMVINLSLLNKIKWLDKEYMSVEPGCTLSAIYDDLLPKGRIIPGGSCASVGIGGLVLGGGYGLLARKFGLTCDSLQEVTMVDGLGRTINSATDKELLWACKGGGNGNFGVITELKFKTHKAPATLQSFRFKTYKTDATKATAILKKWFEVTALLPPSCFSAYVLNGKTVYILLTNTDKPTAVVQDAITNLSAISGKTTKTMAQPLAKALKVFYGRKDPLNFKNASAGLYKNFAEIESFIEKIITSTQSAPGMIYQVNTLAGNIINDENETAAAFPHRAYPYFSELQSYWETPAQGKRLMEKFAAIQSLFFANGITAQYRNYPDINFSNWQTAYYGNNYNRLQQVKKKYDPQNIINHPQSIQLPRSNF